MTNIVVGVTSVALLACAVITGFISTFFLPECINGSPQGLFGPCDCPVAFSGDGCEYENCVNGFEIGGLCECENKWHGDFCNICNTVNQAKCLGQCLSGEIDAYYGDVCENYCLIEDPARGYCTIDGPVCTQDWAGPNCSFACSDCTTNQVCVETQAAGAKCVCGPEYYNFPYCNVTCETPAICPGDVECTETCAGHGECTQGRCTCSESGFYVGLQCEFTCPGDPFYNSPCSAHGSCLYDVSGSYCSCEEGWGVVEDCSCNDVESCGACEEGAEGCISRGRCDAGLRGCTCEPGYDAASNCDTCDEGYVGSGDPIVCFECPGGPNLPVCSGHGVCEMASGSPICTCDENWDGPLCDVCSANYYPKSGDDPLCVHYCEASETCNGNENSCAADGTCDCSGNFGGDNCTVCDGGWFPERGDDACTVQCIDDGEGQTCVFGSCSEYGVCVCDDGASGVNCEINCPSNTDEPCSGHGECLYDEELDGYSSSTKIQTCQCDSEWYGAACNNTPPIFNDLVCSGNGRPEELTLSEECDTDGDCDENFFCGSVKNPYMSKISETSCNTKNDECFDAINQADYTELCLNFYKSKQPCPGYSGDVACVDCTDDDGLFSKCKGDPVAFSSDPCRHHIEESSCDLDAVCIFRSGECRSRVCTDVTAAAPSQVCLNIVSDEIPSEEAFFIGYLDYKLHAMMPLPSTPPVDVLDNDLYADAATLSQSDLDSLVCNTHPSEFSYSSGKSYVLHCLNGDTVPIQFPSVTRPPGCFVEEVEGLTVQPADFNVLTSEYRDCKRSGLTNACGTSSETIDYSKNYVRSWAHIAEQNVVIRTDTIVITIINSVLKVGSEFTILETPYVLLEVERDTVDTSTVNLRVDSTQVYSGSHVILEDGLFLYSRSADSSDCAERFDQVSYFTDASIFTNTAVSTDCLEYDSTAKLAYCMLKDEANIQTDAYYNVDMTPSEISSCFQSLGEWSLCSSTCLSSLYDDLPCTESCTNFSAPDLFSFCTHKLEFEDEDSISKVPSSIKTTPSCMEGPCVSTLGSISDEVLEDFCEDYLKEKGTCRRLSCKCDGGYDGEKCEITCPIGNGKTCSGNGKCVATSTSARACVGENITSCDYDIMGHCECEEGSGSACTIECDHCSFAPYTSRKSQRGACNSEFGVCEVLPPGMVFDYESAIASGQNVGAVKFNRDGSVGDDSYFNVMSVTSITKQVRQNNCGQGILSDDLRVEKIGATTRSKQEMLDAVNSHPDGVDPYTFLFGDPDMPLYDQGVPNEWTEVSSCHAEPGSSTDCSAFTNKTICKGSDGCRWYSIPASLDTVGDVLLNTYSYEQSVVEQDCIAYPNVKRTLQMQSRFNMASLLEFYSYSPKWSVGEAVLVDTPLVDRVTDPERTNVDGYDIIITLSSEVTTDADGSIYSDPVYVIDAFRNNPEVNSAGNVEVTIGPNTFTIPIYDDMSRTFLKGCLMSITGGSRSCNEDASGEATASTITRRVVPVEGSGINSTVFLSFDKEMIFSGIYSGGSGVCGISSDLTCPGSITEMNLPCSGHGTCTRSSCSCTCDITPEKAAEPGQILSMQNFMDHSPYRGRGCDKTCPGYDGISMSSVCSGRGVCNYRGRCQCEERYRGDNCEYTCPFMVGDNEEETDVCNNHGMCEVTTLDLSLFEHPYTGTLNYDNSSIPEIGDEVTEVTFTFEKRVDNYAEFLECVETCIADTPQQCLDVDPFEDDCPEECNNNCGNDCENSCLSEFPDFDSNAPSYSVKYTCIRLNVTDAVLLECAACKCDESNQNRLGSWAGAVCSECAHNVYGPACFSRCPHCGDHGICDWGKTGSGECLCGSLDFGGKVRNNEINGEDEENGLSTRVYSRYKRDDTVLKKDVTAGEGELMFKPGSNCKACIKGFDGPTCSHEALPCLMRGTSLSLPSTFNECECRNSLFDPKQHCCPYGWGVPTEVATEENLALSRSKPLRDLIGTYNEEQGEENRICFSCPNSQNPVLPREDDQDGSLEYLKMQNALVYSATVCDADPKHAQCISEANDMVCRCTNSTMNAVNCYEPPFIDTLPGCPEGMGWNCGGACGNVITCEHCPSGWAVPPKGPCEECEGGKYSTGTSCELCPVGYYNDEWGQTSCKSCLTDPRVYYATFAEQLSFGLNAALVPGFKRRMYQDEEGQRYCKWCPEGFGSREVEQLYADAPDNSLGYINVEDFGNPVDPDIKAFSVNRKDWDDPSSLGDGPLTYDASRYDATKCEFCAYGYISTDGAYPATECTKCPSGKFDVGPFTDAFSSTECAECPSNEPDDLDLNCIIDYFDNN